MSNEDQRAAMEATLRELQTERDLLHKLLRLEVLRDQAGGLDTVSALLAEHGRQPMDIDAAIARMGVDSVGDRLVDLRRDIDALRSLLDDA
jgi:hypothetical protein